MTTDQPLKCPVCATPFSPGQPHCANPDCGWPLNSGPVLGRLTPEAMQTFQRRLAEAREAYRRKMEQRAALLPDTPISPQNVERLTVVRWLGMGEIYHVAFSPDGSRLAVGSKNGIFLYHSARLIPLRFFPALTGVVSVAFSPDGSLIASVSDDETVRLWRAEDGQPLRTLHRHTDDVHSVTFSPDGRLLASASADKTVLLWGVR